MYRKILATVLAVVVLQTTLVRAKVPDWIPPEMLDMIAEDKARCMEEHGTKQELIDAINNGEMLEDRSLTCYMFCLFDTFSVVDDEGNVDADVLVSFLPENMQDRGNNAFGPCANPDGADVCEKMLNFGKCIHAKDPGMLFMV